MFIAVWTCVRFCTIYNIIIALHHKKIYFDQHVHDAKPSSMSFKFLRPKESIFIKIKKSLFLSKTNVFMYCFAYKAGRNYNHAEESV